MGIEIGYIICNYHCYTYTVLETLLGPLQKKKKKVNQTPFPEMLTSIINRINSNI